jgi:hypothetical protein
MALFMKQERDRIALVPRLVLIVILSLALYQYDQRIFFVYAFFIYLIISYSIRFLLIPGSTFTGVSLMRQDRFEEAIPFIEKDINYYTERAWIDKFRFVLMISSSGRSFREISLCNMAYCLLQTGKVKECTALYESVLTQYPGNVVAKTQLNTINIVTKSVKGMDS